MTAQLMTAQLTVDLSNKSAFITTPTGRTIAAWSGVTRRTALELARAAGWAPAGAWALTCPPDGFYCPVVGFEEINQEINYG